MPNWCFNNLTMHWDPSDDAVVAAVKGMLGADEMISFARMRPLGPKDDAASAWGTKWDLDPMDAEMDLDMGSGFLSVLFDTAWSPPIAALEHWHAGNPGVRATLLFAESGNCLAGCTEYADGVATTQKAPPSNAAAQAFLCSHGWDVWPDWEDEDGEEGEPELLKGAPLTSRPTDPADMLFADDI